MDELNITLKNCYGITELSDFSIDFKKYGGCIIYSPNGTMKTSFSNTFLDLSKGKKSKDRIFKKESSRVIYDENGNEINKDNVFVIERFNDKFKFDKTSKLLVNQDLKEKYDDLLKEIKDSKQILIKSIQEYVKSDSKDKITLKDIESIFINDLCEFGDNFIDIILNLPKIEENLLPVEDLRHDTLFHETNIKLVSKSTIQKNIFEYCEEYNKLIEGSEIFNNEFAHNNALNIEDNLKSNGFFKAEHKLKLSNGTIINSKSDLKNLVKKEKERILKDMENKFDDIDNQLDKSKKNLRDLIRKYPEIMLPGYLNISDFKKNIWFSILNKIQLNLNSLVQIVIKNEEELKKLLMKQIKRNHNGKKQFLYLKTDLKCHLIFV